MLGMIELTLESNQCFFQDHRCASDEEYIDRIKSVQFKEIAMKSYKSDDQEPMDILTDACLCWQKSSKSSIAVAVLSHRKSWLVSTYQLKRTYYTNERTIRLGKIHQELNKDDIAFVVWIHDCNGSINKLIKEKNTSPTRILNERGTASRISKNT